MTEEKEIWKPLPDEKLKNLYEISNLGNYRKTETQQIMKPYKAGKYMMASFGLKGKYTRYLVHRLVAVAFVEDPDDDPKKDTVNHIDGNKMNNNASNLEWCTLSQNSVHARQILNQRKSTKKVIRIDKDGNTTEYASITEASIITGIRRQSITDHIRGRKTIPNYDWKYADEKYNKPNVDLDTMDKIADFAGYFINKEGSIYGVNKSQFLTFNMSDGYPKVLLYKNGQPHCFYVHILVAKTYIPNPKNKLVVNHIDHNKTNCHVSNLEWVSHSENANAYFNMKRNSSVLSHASKDHDGDGENSSVQVQADEH